MMKMMMMSVENWWNDDRQGKAEVIGGNLPQHHSVSQGIDRTTFEEPMNRALYCERGLGRRFYY
jgi:hypothetical protein